MEWKNLFQSKKFKWLLIAIGSLIVLLLVFQTGVFVGFQKARFSFGWGDNYNRVFGGPRGGFLRDFEGRDFINGHGTAGSIIKVDGNNIIIKGQDNVEKIVTISGTTTIRKGNTDIKASDLKANDQIVVIGTPNSDGSIEAKIIRIFDPTQTPPPPRPFPFNIFGPNNF